MPNIESLIRISAGCHLSDPLACSLAPAKRNKAPVFIKNTGASLGKSADISRIEYTVYHLPLKGISQH